LFDRSLERADIAGYPEYAFIRCLRVRRQSQPRQLLKVPSGSNTHQAMQTGVLLLKLLLLTCVAKVQ
jgi:hypothetical protein